MISLFLTMISITVTCSFLIIIVILLDKGLNKNYSRRWKYVLWAAIAIRLIIPINMRVIDIELPVMIDRTLENNNNQINILKQNDSFYQQKGNSSKSTKTDKSMIKNTNETTSKKNDNTASIKIDTSASKTAASSPEMNTNTNSSKTAASSPVKNIDTNTSKTADTTLIRNLRDTSYNKASIFVVPIQMLYIITIIWIFGSFLFLLYHCMAYYHFKKRINRWSKSVKNAELLDLFGNLCVELKIKHKINLVTCKQVSSPILTGFMKPSIILPDKEYTLEQFQFILRHELIHHRNHDLYYKLLLLFANALHWFNPFIHIMTYYAYYDMELYCDEKLIANNNNINFREKYGITLLQIMTGERKNNHILLSSSFSNKKKQVKNRFKQIMNAKPMKKGTLIMRVLCLFLIVGSLVSFVIPFKNISAENLGKQTNRIISENSLKMVDKMIETLPQNNLKQLKSTCHILVVGIDSAGGAKNTDSILLVSINPKSKKIFLTSFLRDTYVEIPKHGRNKLSASYRYGGIKLMKKTIEYNFDLRVDHTCSVNMEAFENIINTIGGVEIKLTEKEAEYLNHTNYISNKKYRTVIAGKQHLNGNQALGYVRVRKVPTLQGENGDIGRTTRLRRLIVSVIQETSKKDITVIIKLVKNVLVNVSTDLDNKQIVILLHTALNKDITTKSVLIPVKGSYTEKVKDGMYVFVPDLKKNKIMLNHIFSQDSEPKNK